MNQLVSICFCFRQLVMATPSPTSLKIQKTRERVKAARNCQLFLDEDSDEDIVEKETLRGGGVDALDIILDAPDLDIEREVVLLINGKLFIQ